jgi:hypothetical protein
VTTLFTLLMTALPRASGANPPTSGGLRGFSAGSTASAWSAPGRQREARRFSPACRRWMD